jgi:hypothetical protein
MNKRTLICGILGCALLAFGFTQCDMGASTSSALTGTVCDAGADAVCTPVTPNPPPPSGW